MACPICASSNSLELKKPSSPPMYHKCLDCEFVWLDMNSRLDPNEERVRYSLHQNSLSDQGYVNFLSSIVEIVKSLDLTENSQCLDYGCGPTINLGVLLSKLGLNVKNYDPYFLPEWPNQLFDLITCCEVAEHFYEPLIEFQNIRTLLASNGALVVKTQLYQNEDLFTWHYSRDKTHTSFYSQKNLEIIKQKCGFHQLAIIDNRHFILKN